MSYFLRVLGVVLCCHGNAIMAAEPREIYSTLADQHSVAVTVYNADLALIKDRRQLTLPAGRVTLAWRDVSAQIHPETALLRALTADAPVRVIEQNFDFDLLTPDKLLEKYVGREVGFVTTHPTTGEETEERATVLAAQEGVVLRIGERIEAGSGRLWGRIVYRDLPPTLRDRPTLSLQLDNPSSAPQQLELSYLTGGLSWRADYVGELDAAAEQLALTGWVTLANQSGATYRAAQLQLVAGEVHRAPPERDFALAAPRLPPVAAASAMQEESLFEYHLYTLPEPTTLADRQTKQVALLVAPQVKVHKELLVTGNDSAYREARRGDLADRLPVTVWLELVNDEQSGLGLPLPAGIVRIYQRDSRDNAQFIGEDRIAHTPTHERLRLKLGEAFDVTAARKQTELKKLSGSGPWQYQYEGAFEIVLRNAKPEAVTIQVQESIPGDWSMLAESHPHTKGNANTAVWRLTVAPASATTLTYRVRVRW